MRTVIGLFCVLAIFLTAPGCGGSATTAPAEGDAQPEETKAPVETDGAVEGSQETTESGTDAAPEEMTADDAVPATEAEEEVIVETFDTEARPSVLLRIMLEPITDAMDAQASSLNLPGMGG